MGSCVATRGAAQPIARPMMKLQDDVETFDLTVSDKGVVCISPIFVAELERLHLEHFQSALLELGVESASDIKHVTDEELQASGLKIVQVRKLRNLAARSDSFSLAAVAYPASAATSFASVAKATFADFAELAADVAAAWQETPEQAPPTGKSVDEFIADVPSERQLAGQSCNCESIADFLGGIRREMNMATQGAVLRKVANKHGITQERLVRVVEADSALVWCHQPDSWLAAYKGVKTLDLRSVVHIYFGGAEPWYSKPSLEGARLPEDSAWLRFTLSDATRLYTFICPDIDTVQCFVLAVSKLCVNAAGGVRTRSDFLRVFGLLRVEALRHPRRQTLGGKANVYTILSSRCRQSLHGAGEVRKLSLAKRSGKRRNTV